MMLADKKLAVHVAACFLATFAVLFLWQQTTVHLFDIIWNVDTYSHGLIIPFVSFGLIWSRREQIHNEMLQFDTRGLPFLVMASLVWLVAVAGEIKVLEHFSLILAVQASVLITMGLAFYRTLLFPFLFLFLMVPVGDSLIPVLQTLTAESVLAMLAVLQVPYEAEGVLISLSSGMYEVARACAGIKFFFTSLVTGILLAHLAYKGWRGRFIIILVAALLPVVANALRVLGILLIAEATDQSFAKGVDHIVYGWGFLTFILLMLVAIAYKFASKDGPHPTENVRSEADKNDSPQVSFGKGVTVLVIALLLPIGAWAMRPMPITSIASANPLAAPSCENCEYRLLKSGKGSRFAEWRGADSTFQFLYRSAADTIVVSGALYCPERRGRKLLQPGNLAGGKGWEQLPGANAQLLDVGGWKLEKRLYWKNTQRRVVYVGYVVGETGYSAEWKVQLATIWQRIFSGHSAGAVYAIAVDGKSDFARDSKKIENFLSTFPQEKFLWEGLQFSSEGQVACVA